MCSMRAKSLSVDGIAMSSAYVNFWLVVGGRSAVYMLKRAGERTEPCGKPLRRVFRLDLSFPM